MDFQKTVQYLSQPRFGKYLVATGNDFNSAMALYKANLKIAAAFHPLLGITEVVLRNELNNVLTKHFKDSNWIRNQKSGFMSHPTLTFTSRRTGKVIVNNFLKTSVEAAEKRFKYLDIKVTAAKIISEQNFSFWTDLFEVHHYKILQGRPIQIFHHLPTGYGRLEAWEMLTKIRLFRNRIQHNEPICFSGTEINFERTRGIHEAIKEILSWIDPELKLWIRDIDSVEQNIKAIESL